MNSSDRDLRDPPHPHLLAAIGKALLAAILFTAAAWLVTKSAFDAFDVALPR